MKLRRYFRTEDYFVSPVNYHEDIISCFHLPETVEIHDCTLRDGEQQAGVAFSYDDKIRIAELLAEAGVHRIEAGMPAVSKEDQRAIEDIVRRQLGPDIFVFSRAMESDIRLAAELGVDGVVVEIPSNDELIQFGYRWPKEKATEAVIKATKLAHELGLNVSLFLMDSSRLRVDDFVRRVQEIKNDGWVDSCCLVDTQGVLSTPATRYFIQYAVKQLGIPVESHFHNDLGLAVANTLAGFESGSSILHTTVLGIGPRAGQAATEQVVIALRLLYGVDIGLDLKKMYSLGEEISRLANFTFPVNQPILGDVLYTLESGLAVSWWRNIKDDRPLALYGILPSVSDRPDVQVALGKSSGAASILYWLDNLGLQLKNEDSIPEILTKVKEKAVEKKGSLNEDDFYSIVKEYTASGDKVE